MLQPGDSPKALASLGLRLKRKRKQDCILQPCPAHDGRRCMIYESRPVRCRIFECRQLNRVAAGAITEEEALEKISEARRLVSEVNALLLRLGTTNSKQPLAKRFENMMNGNPDSSPDDPATHTRSQLTRAMRDLETLLEQYFRIETLELPEVFGGS